MTSEHLTSEPPPGRDAAGTLRTALGEAGIEVVASLPDSWLSPLLTALDADPRIRHVKVTREDDALGIAAGAALAGGLGAVVCQNAGLLVGANALAGYVHLHELPLLVLAAQRGDIDDGFYYQAYKGRVVPPVLDAIGVPYHRMRGGADPRMVIAAADQARLHRRPVVLLLDRESLLGEGAR
ncbi:thiamine pyrophosphate-binding protein [Actinomadura sp. GC306]|uniref:thiamine pyrophosphate-binding protein n=1 Tax=Actinomadura sp. GC306 TaxID=2530367 RepID=UPI001404379C|nr:thiamine pyrophosphate-binding protein [Actinomadura sp. GC306]